MTSIHIKDTYRITSIHIKDTVILNDYHSHNFKTHTERLAKDKPEFQISPVNKMTRMNMFSLNKITKNLKKNTISFDPITGKKLINGQILTNSFC